MNHTNGYFIKDFGITIDIGKILKICFRNAWTMILAGITSALLFIVVCETAVTPTYVTTTKFYIMNYTMQTYITTYDVSASTSFTQDYQELLCSRNILESVISKIGADLTFEELKDEITIQAEKTNSRLFEMIIEDTDPYRCCELARGLCMELNAYVKENIPSCSVQVVESPVYPYDNYAPRTKIWAVLGFLFGGVIAFGIVCIIHLTNTKIVTDKDIRKYLDINVLGTIPVNPSKRDKK